MNFFANSVVFIHVLSAIIWLGGMFFIALVMVPTLKKMETPKKRIEIISQAAKKFRIISWICILVLLITGFLNVLNRGITIQLISSGRLFDSYFGKILTIKVTLVLLMVVLSITHDFIIGPKLSRTVNSETSDTGFSPGIMKNRKSVLLLARINAFLGIIVVGCAVFLS